MPKKIRHAYGYRRHGRDYRFLNDKTFYEYNGEVSDVVAQNYCIRLCGGAGDIFTRRFQRRGNFWRKSRRFFGPPDPGVYYGGLPGRGVEIPVVGRRFIPFFGDRFYLLFWHGKKHLQLFADFCPLVCCRGAFPVVGSTTKGGCLNRGAGHFFHSTQNSLPFSIALWKPTFPPVTSAYRWTIYRPRPVP